MVNSRSSPLGSGCDSNRGGGRMVRGRLGIWRGKARCENVVMRMWIRQLLRGIAGVHGGVRI